MTHWPKFLKSLTHFKRKHQLGIRILKILSLLLSKRPEVQASSSYPVEDLLQVFCSETYCESHHFSGEISLCEWITTETAFATRLVQNSMRMHSDLSNLLSNLIRVHMINGQFVCMSSSYITGNLSQNVTWNPHNSTHMGRVQCNVHWIRGLLTYGKEIKIISISRFRVSRTILCRQRIFLQNISYP